MTNQEIATRQPSALQVLRSEFEQQKAQFEFALPAHIPVERFIRVIVTALQKNPTLQRCSKQSLFNAAMRAAQDGLLPDGREAALVPFGDDPESGKGRPDVAQYLPMVRGIRKLVRNSRMISDWNVQIVQEGDEFDFQLGDDPFIHHKPSRTGGRTRKVLWAYSIATFPDGTKSREVMNIDQIMDIQKKSRAKRGPWSDPIFFPEMCRKTVAHLHSKQLPMSTDLDTVMRRDDELYDFKGERERRQEGEKQRPPSIAAALDSFADGVQDDHVATDAAQEHRGPEQTTASPPVDTITPTGTAAHGTDATPVPDAGAREASNPADSQEHKSIDPRQVAWERGKTDKVKGMSRKAVPPEYRDPSRTTEALAWAAGWEGVPL